MHEIYEMREAHGWMAGRRAALSTNHGEIAAELRAQCDAQREFLKQGDVDGYREIDIGFHRNLWILCGNVRLRRPPKN